jgi:hypothetical protein
MEKNNKCDWILYVTCYSVFRHQLHLENSKKIEYIKNLHKKMLLHLKICVSNYIANITKYDHFLLLAYITSMVSPSALAY